MSDTLCFVCSERLVPVATTWQKALNSSIVLYRVDEDKQGTGINEVDTCLEEYRRTLNTKQLGQCLLYCKRLDSTQTYLHLTLKPRAPDGFVCFTKSQTDGKGRGKNKWESPEGCLTFSYNSTFTDGNTLPLIQYLVSLAIIKSVEKWDPTCTCVQIKWPNDIYANGQKIGGVLCQSEFSNGTFGVTTGVGLNLSNCEPTTCLCDIISNASGLTKEAFLATFCNILEPMEKQFKVSGFEPFRREYLQKWLHTNQTVQYRHDRDSQAMPAVIRGLTQNGCLLAEGSAGQKLELYPDGNSLDFFSGLLTRK